MRHSSLRRSSTIELEAEDLPPLANVSPGERPLGAAESFAREAVALAEETDFLVVHADGLVDLAEVLRAAGRADEALSALGDALLLYERKGNVTASRRTQALLAADSAAVGLHAER